MPKSKLKGEEEIVEEQEEAGVIDDTETPTTDADEATETEDETTETTENKASTEETEEKEDVAEEEEPVASAEELTKTQQRIKELEAENARLKGEPKKEEPEIRRATALDDFAKRIVPQTKQKFLDATPVTVKEDGTVVALRAKEGEMVAPGTPLVVLEGLLP